MKISKYFPLISLILLSLLTTCQSDNSSNASSVDSSSEILGHWTSEIAAEEGFDEDRRALANEMMGGMMNFHFMEGNRVESSVAGYETQGTYEQIGNKIKLSFEDDSELELLIAGSSLLWEQPELTMRFYRVDAPQQQATHPLQKAVMDRFDDRKSDPLQGIWELKAINNSQGQALYALEELEEGVLLSFHQDGTYTKHLTAQRQVNGTFTKTGSNITLASELGSAKTFNVKKMTSKELQLQENGTDIVRYYLALGAE